MLKEHIPVEEVEVGLRPVEVARRVEEVEVAFGLLKLRDALKRFKWPSAC